ncbi:BPSL0761 family protein [Pseudoxanthomonas mexicana]|uniref:BPSL0761 family protein n=1 Tax=Pseudoxanthomonas mexicana TaxID=128785 RepID=UPI0024E273A2|nr:BPSL0761 family protein [Pseudoxanthomonas mexicana]
MPVERTRNLIQAGAFLRDLSANQHVPREIRTEAYRLLRHFPSVSDVAAIAENEARLLEVAKSHLLQNYLVADFDPEWVRGDVPPVLSSTANWSPIPPDQEIGREETLFRRTDHRLPA